MAENEKGTCPDCCTMELIACGLARYPTGGVGVGTGGGPTMGVGLVPDEVARPPCRIDCLLFWNLQRPMGSEITTRMSTKELNRPNILTPCRHSHCFARAAPSRSSVDGNAVRAYILPIGGATACLRFFLIVGSAGQDVVHSPQATSKERYEHREAASWFGTWPWCADLLA